MNLKFKSADIEYRDQAFKIENIIREKIQVEFYNETCCKISFIFQKRRTREWFIRVRNQFKINEFMIIYIKEEIGKGGEGGEIGDGGEGGEKKEKKEEN